MADQSPRLDEHGHIPADVLLGDEHEGWTDAAVACGIPAIEVERRAALVERLFELEEELSGAAHEYAAAVAGELSMLHWSTPGRVGPARERMREAFAAVVATANQAHAELADRR
jgi:hypothetical protein